MNKQELRHQIRSIKRHFTRGQLAEMSEAAIGKLLAEPHVKAARTILMYYSLDDEVDTHKAADILIGMGKIVLLPAVTSSTTMEVRMYAGKQDLRAGSFNIMEPAGEVFTNYEDIDVAVIPGMGFDKQCNRLGRGKGYYDQFLGLMPQAFKIGLCFPFQKFDSIPADKHDVKMDLVL